MGFLLRMVACLLMFGIGCAQALEYRVDTIAKGLEFPWSLAFLPDGRMLVTERVGRLRVIDKGVLLPDAITGLPEIFVSGQAGLFDVVLDPDFATNQMLYLSFAHGSKNKNHTRVIRARLVGDALQEVTPIFTVKPAKRGDVHYGARMAFLPDGTLVIGTGDGFNYREQAQKLGNHLGKIVRIHTDGTVPADNPFVGNAKALPEIYSLGHRNVQGMVFNAVTGKLFAHEHGPRGGDEINIIEAGRNYGWPLITYGVDYSGAIISPYTEKPGLEQPLVHWTPSIAPAGMTMYRGNLFPQWQGSLFVSALAGEIVQRVPFVDGRAGPQESLFGELHTRFRDVRTGPDGALYLLTDKSFGRVLRVVPHDQPSAP
jgi:glucose/arabinose dehydrogenase